MTFDPTGPPIIPGPAEPYTLASMMPAPVVKPPRPGWVVPVITGLVVLVLVLGGVAGWALTRTGGDVGTPAVPGAATTAPTLRQNPPTTTYATPTPTDFTLTVNVLSKKCFGSAGCNVTYAMDVVYGGGRMEPGKTWDVTYEVKGGDDPQINTFQVTATTGTAMSVSVRREESIQTPSSDSVLTATATRVAAH